MPPLTLTLNLSTLCLSSPRFSMDHVLLLILQGMQYRLIRQLAETYSSVATWMILGRHEPNQHHKTSVRSEYFF